MAEPMSRVAVVGDGGDGSVPHARQAVENGGARLVDSATADAVVAIGDDVIRDVIVAEAEAGERMRPVVPVRDGDRSTDVDRVESAVRGLLDGTGRVVPSPVLTVETGGSIAGRAVFDVTLVTDEPARISEYAVEIAADRRESFRSDGVTVATPFGSEGYANAAGGPVIAPGAGIAVVPIAPFTTRSDAWVVDGGVRLSVERESEAVSLVVDGSRRDVVVPGHSVDVTVSTRVDVVLEPAESSRTPATDRKGSNNS